MESVRPLYSSEAIAGRVHDLAATIAAAVGSEVVLVGLLKGSFMFVADLVRALSQHGTSTRVEFISASSYGNSRESSGTVSVSGLQPEQIEGRRVLLVDDIIDTGRTLERVSGLLLEQGAAHVWTCCLLDKSCKRAVDFQADFIGFEVDDLFVVGYGIDYAENYRDLPYIGTID